MQSWYLQKSAQLHQQRLRSGFPQPAPDWPRLGHQAQQLQAACRQPGLRRLRALRGWRSKSSQDTGGQLNPGL